MRLTPVFYCCLLLLCLTAQKAMAQEEKTYKAIVLDSIEKTLVEKATVELSGNKTSGKFMTDKKGTFSISLKSDSSILTIQHIGYREKRLTILSAKIPKGIDTIYLMPAENRLDDIVIKTKVPPIVVKGDTTEFNIDSSMFENFDVVQDLVRRLPGLEIDAEGKMSFHGKPITRILVDGEDLFGGDPEFSMKKLPAGMVAKIQVMDTKTLEQLFTRTPSDGEDKTLNIQLKPGNKTFGSGDALVGTRNQLEGNGSLSMFEGRRKISASGNIASSNKIGLAKIGSGPSSSSANASANYSNKVGQLHYNANYGYNQNESINNMYRERTQLITADTSFFTTSRSRTQFGNNAHRFSVNGNLFIDSSSSLDFTINFATSEGQSEMSSSSATLENGSLRSQSGNISATKSKSENLGGSFNWRKYLNRRGRSLMVSGRVNQSVQKSDAYTQSLNTYFKNNQPVSGDTLDRLTRTLGNSKSYSFTVNYVEPISKKLNFNLRGSFDFSTTDNDRLIYNLDSAKNIESFDSLFSARTLSTFNTQNVGGSFNYTAKNWNMSSGMTVVFQQSLRTLQKEQIQQNLLRFGPSLNATYYLSKEKSIRANFSANTQQPSIDQLQPVPDNSNPLFIRIGNPDLKTSFSQSYGITYLHAKSGNNFTANLGYSPTSNQIVNAVFFDQFRRQTSQYINVNGVYTARGNISISRLKQEEKKARTITASAGINYGQQVFFQSNQMYQSRNYTTNTSFSFSRRQFAVRSPAYTISLTGSYGRNWTPADTKILNTTRLSITPRLDGSCNVFGALYATASYQLLYNRLDYHSTLRRNDEYNIHQVNSSIDLRIAKKYSLQSHLTYQYNTQVPAGTNKAMVNCGASATTYVLKGKGFITLQASDLFALNQNLRRVVGENFIEDVQIDNLRNFFTLKMQYNFSKLERRDNRKPTSNTK